MKEITLLVLALFLSFQARAEAPQKSKKMIVCERLYKQAEENCVESMCEEYTADDKNAECVMDGDFREGLQICIIDNELPELLAAYNKKHPGKNLSCEE